MPARHLRDLPYLAPRPGERDFLHTGDARLLLRDGEVEQAVRQYRQAVAEEPELADVGLEAHLGIDADDLDSEVIDGRLRAADGLAPTETPLEVERPRVSFADVGGMESVKDEIRLKIIHPLAQPELYKAYGKPIGGGILMYGPPGCGKTHLARATAGEVQAGFISVGLNDVLEMWIGQSERNLHELFELARSKRPCVLFFDEVDALGASRTDMKHSAGRQLINQFLAELDGLDATNEGVLILGATNAPWHLDSAFRRPGRFDRIIFVPPPDVAARAAILRVLLKDKPARDIDYGAIAPKTDAFSGADLKALVDEAIENKLREALRRGVPAPLTTADLLTALKRRKPSTKEWLATARNYALYSNQGGIYDDILAYLKLT
jgi:SpoVK/Ycf46/Vps4 family AAA+-type ATPase